MTTSHLYQRVCHRLVTAANTRRDESSGDAGFTVLEAIVSLTIFVIISTAAVLAILGSQKAENTTRNRVAAANIAQSDLEQARAVPSPAAATYIAAAPGDSAKYSVTRTVTYPSAGATTCPAGGVIKVSVVVSWATGTTSQVRTDTVVACP